MSRELARLLDRVAGCPVAVIGEGILDAYLEGTVRRLCQEAPVPLVDVTGEVDAPGGAANVAVNVGALGGAVRLLSVVGDDREGERLRVSLEDRGVSPRDLVVEVGRRTLAKTRVVAGSQVVVRFDRGTTGPVGPPTARALAARLSDAVRDSQAVVVSDYGYGALPGPVLGALRELQAGRPRLLVVDARDLRRYRSVGVHAVKPNFAEALRALGRDDGPGEGDREAFLLRRGHRLLEAAGARVAAVTLDAEGAIVFERGRAPHRTYARPGPSARAVGAGDTFTAAFALGLAAGAAAPMAAELASQAAALVVGKPATAACSADELRSALLASSGALLGVEALVRRVQGHRERGRRIVFTNGCFDLLHPGHIACLNRAKALGDVLVVGLNSDDSVRRLKGPGRSLNPLEDRAEVLAALSCIDHIVPFREDVPLDLIRRVRPDVYVKGGDHARDRLPEAALVEDLGGRVVILPHVEDRSTTGIIARVREGAGSRGGPAVPPASPGAAASACR